jgi:hypothetical protein
VGKEGGRKIVKPEQFQLLMMAIGPVATLFGVFIALLLQNHHVDVRVGDLKDLLRAEMRAHQSELLAKFAELDTRLTRIENERRIVQ